MSGRKQHDLYKILGVKKSSTTSDIRAAFMKKALVWHPDKAPNGASDEETEENKKKFEQKYLDLQRAYKILINPNARDQYNNTLQNTYKDLHRKDGREVGYKKSNKYKVVEDGKVKFDGDTFAEDFNKTRQGQDSTEFKNLQEKYNKTGNVSKSEYEKMLENRDQELDDIKVDKVMSGTGNNFDINTFNNMFDQMKKTNQESKGVAEYQGEPMGLFSDSKGLVEDSNLGGISMNYGMGFQSTGMNSMVEGSSENPNKAMDISQFKTSDYVTGRSLLSADSDTNYGKIGADSHVSMLDRVAQMQTDRERLMALKDTEFVVNQSEIEKQYSELFEMNDHAMKEGLEGRKRHQKK